MSWKVPSLASLCFVGLTATALAGAPVLVADVSAVVQPGQPLRVPIRFTGGGEAITAIAFSLDIDTGALGFDPVDADFDGVPDAVSFPSIRPPLVFVDFDASDTDGELDVLLGDLSGTPLPDGALLEIELLPSNWGTVGSWLRFSTQPPPSFGDATGRDVPGYAYVIGFSDGFESGDPSTWSVVVP